MSKISVVTVCYNCAELIEATVQNVLEQAQDVVELIVIDGGSTDGTIEIIEKYKTKIAYLKSERDLGIYDAMNKGIKAAKGDWLLFLNAGDSFYPGFKADKLSFKWPSSAEFIVFPFFVEGNIGISLPVLNRKTWLPSSHQATLMLTRIAKETLFDLKYKVAADFAQYKHRMKFNKNCVYVESNVITKVKPGGFSYKNRDLMMKEYFRILLNCDGVAAAFIWKLRSNPVIFRLVKVLLPQRLFFYLKSVFV